MADFTNIDGVYAKDTELRSGIDTLRTTVLSNTIKPLTVTKNGTYTAIPSSGTYGYSPITVDVQEEPWEPLQDGYSNFWFELDNDTLSPWLNFSAKNNNATIDWGDGSGEVALDTLTPTHTYSKAGKYIVKCKGVTGIGRQNTPPYNGYQDVLVNVELNADVNSLITYCFSHCFSLKNVIINNASATVEQVAFGQCCNIESVVLPANLTNVSTSTFNGAYKLKSVQFPSGALSFGTSVFYNCYSMNSCTIPATVTSIGNTCFMNCFSLVEIHCLSTVPPTLGTNVFGNLPTNFIIYAPVGYGDTYKQAEGWSTYADHIVEEGQTLSMAALRRIQAEKNDNGEEMR